MFDVGIVGFGPVGAVAANLFGQAGIRTAVIDKTDLAFDKPRAIAFDHEVMRTFQNICVAEQVSQHVGPYVPTEFRGLGRRPIARFMSKPAPYRFGWQSNYVFNQPAVEGVIRSGTHRYKNIEFFLNRQVVALSQAADDSFATLALRGSDDCESLVQARFVIACDGANSTIRKLLDIPLISLGLDRPFLVVDAIVVEPALSRLPAVNVQHCDPSRPASYIVGPGAHRRWEIMLLDGEGDEVLRPQKLNALLANWIGVGEAEIWRAATYMFHALYASRWRAGRVFLTGDAAHQTPPFLGQGMAQGIRDVVNLGWKIDLILRGRCDDQLLDSYEAERLPHVIKTTDRAVSLGRIICELDPAKAALRDAAMLAENGDPPLMQYRQDLIPPLDIGVRLPTTADVSGQLAPQPRVKTADNNIMLLDDVTEGGFRLIADEPFAAAIGPEWWQLFDDIGLQVVVFSAEPAKKTITNAVMVADVTGDLEAWLREMSCRAILVRPDHYIFAALADEGDLPIIAGKLIDSLKMTQDVSPLGCNMTP